MRFAVRLAGVLNAVLWVSPGLVGAGVVAGGGLTAVGPGTLDVLPGGGSRIVWSLDVASNTWTVAGTAPGATGPGGAISYDLFGRCDYVLAGGGSSDFFRTAGSSFFCAPMSLANTPAAVGPGGALATAPGLGGAPTDSVFVLRGAGTTDFWRYSIATNTWSTAPTPPPTPGPASNGAALVEVYDNQGFCGSTGYAVAMIRGGLTSDFSCYSISQNLWIPGPALPAPVGPGAALAQLQRFGRIYLLGGGGTTGFWMLSWPGQWTALPSTPGPVGPGGALVGINWGQGDVLYALQGGGSSAVWRFDTGTNTWSHQSDVPNPGGFHTVTPCRVADTRNPTGLSGGPALGANTTRSFPVTGICGIPPTASAVAINVTVVNETDYGNLRLYPAGGAMPGSSAINFTAYKVRANNAVIPVGTGGQISVQCDMPPDSTGQTDFLFDVTGYFE